MRRSSIDGILVLDKPSGMTSREAVNRAQGWFPRGTRIGHTGTLDPLATGVLVLCLGVATRLAEYVQCMPKTYRAGIRLGARSDTDDADGAIIPLAVERPPARAAVELALSFFIGEIAQAPPAYSAALVGGRRAYALARSGAEVNLAPRRVHIDRIDVLNYEWPNLEVEVECGKGTYIRSLARDLGEQLGCGGYITALRRTRVGPFDAADALRLDESEEAARAKLLPIEAALSCLPRITVRPPDALRLRQGQQVPCADHGLTAATDLAAYDEEHRLIGVVKADGDRLRPDKIIART
jgi:tRNA pseudouridine55 synthase